MLLLSYLQTMSPLPVAARRGEKKGTVFVMLRVPHKEGKARTSGHRKCETAEKLTPAAAQGRAGAENLILERCPTEMANASSTFIVLRSSLAEQS